MNHVWVNSWEALTTVCAFMLLHEVDIQVQFYAILMAVKSKCLCWPFSVIAWLNERN